MDEASSGCPDEETVLAFVQGVLVEARRSLVEQHVGICGACAELAIWAAADVATENRVPVADGRSAGTQLAPGMRVGRYQAMELVDGQTIAAWRRERARSWRDVVEVFLAAGRGLAAAHRTGSACPKPGREAQRSAPDERSRLLHEGQPRS